MCNHLVGVTTHGDEVEGGFHKTYGQPIFPYFHNIHLFVGSQKLIQYKPHEEVNLVGSLDPPTNNIQHMSHSISNPYYSSDSNAP
jgi:hypothetical protein